MSDRGLTHIDPLGRARMVDVTPKEATHRRAIARCKVFMTPETTSKVASNAITKGDVLGAARIAGIQAAKRTADMIPLCHPLLVGAVTINFTIGDDHVEVETQVETVDRTGVEMEAMTACSVAALTIYDMCKSADRSMVIGELALWEKTGGRSGHWRRGSTLRDPLVNSAPTSPPRLDDISSLVDDGALSADDGALSADEVGLSAGDALSAGEVGLSAGDALSAGEVGLDEDPLA